MSDYLQNARDFTLNNPNFSHVEGDQHIHHTHTTTATTVQSKSRLWIQGTEEQEGEFEQYHEVKRADVELDRSICNYVPYNETQQRDFDCEKKFFVGEIVRGNGKSSGVMVVGYEGREAREAWVEDFERCTGFLNVDSARLLAIGRSKIPLLIFTRKLVPANQFIHNVGELGRVYFVKLKEQLRCHWREVWMDPQRGAFCRGPEGPKDEFRCLSGFEDAENVPSSVELLQEDVFRRFLAGFKSKWADDVVFGALGRARRWEDANIEFAHPTVISPFTNTPIASGVTRWRDRSSRKLGVLLRDGLSRFTLDDPPAKLSLGLTYPGAAWLSQAWSIFHAHSASLEDDLSQYKLIVPFIHLNLSLSQSDHKRRRRRQQPLFLFIHPLPSTPLQSCTTSSLHYWSFDEDGQTRLSTDICRHLSLPVELELEVYRYFAHSWSNNIYKTIHEYQVARGYDPHTTDFAQSLRHPIFKPIHDDSDRFQEADVVEAPSTVSTAMESDRTSVEDPHPVPQDEEVSPTISTNDGVFAEGEIRDSSEHSESCSQAHPATTQANHKGSLFLKIKRCWRRLKAMKLKDT